MRKLVIFALLLALIGCQEKIETPQANAGPIPEPPKVTEYVNFGDSVVESAKTHLFVRETNGPNRSPEIDAYHDFTGLGYGNPWCLMFVNYHWGQVLKPYDLQLPYKTARVSALLQYALKNQLMYKVIFAKSIIYGVEEALPGDMPIWIKGVSNLPEDNFNGHIGFVIRQDSANGLVTIEGNTGAGAAGSQRDGDGVYIRNRQILLNKDFRIEALVRYLPPETEKK